MLLMAGQKNILPKIWWTMVVQTWPFYPLLEEEIIKIRNFGTTMVHQIFGKNFICLAIRSIVYTLSNVPYCDTHGTPKMVDK